MLRLGVNIDHVATLRNARGGTHPDPVAAAHLAVRAGADSITAHLREDRRHILDADMFRLKAELTVPLNFEMAATSEMQRLALELRPHACCLVPEKREERTTEGGLDVESHMEFLRAYIAPLRDAGIRVSLFIDPIASQLHASLAVGAQAVELHTGAYAHGQDGQLHAIASVAALTRDMPLECHAGHGLTLENVGPIASIVDIIELNIGHALIGDAVFVGLDNAVRAMKIAIQQARA